MVQFSYPPIAIDTTGLATSAKQDTGNTSLASIDSKTPALGQQLAANSQPVVLTAAQVAALTPQTNALTDAQLRASAVPVSLTSTTITNFPVTQAVSATALPLPTGASTSAKQDSLLTELQLKAKLTDTQPVSLASVPLPTGAATETTLAAASAKLPATLGAKTSALSLAVTRPTDEQPYYLTSSVTGTSGTVPISVTLDATGFGGATVDLRSVGTVTSGNLSFSVSHDNVNFQTLNAINDKLADGQPLDGSVPFAVGYQYKMNIGGYKYLKVTIVTLVGTGSIVASVGLSQNSAVLSGINGYVFTTETNSAASLTALQAIDAGTPAALGQTTMANSMPVVLASNQSAIPVTASTADITASGTITTQNLVPAGTATANSTVASGALNGAGTAAVQVTGTYTGALSLQYTVDGTTWITVGGTPFLNAATGALSATITSATQGIFQIEANGFPQFRITALAAVTGTATVTIRTSRSSNIVALDASLPVGTNIIGALVANQSVNAAQINGVAPLMGVGPSGTGALRVVQSNSATATLANVASSATNVTILASAATRMGATFHNDSTSILYLKFGATATTSSYTVKLIADAYYELPQPCYTGIIDGIWSSANGACRVTSW